MTSNRERFEEWYLAEFWEGSNGGRAMLKKEPCGGYTYAKPQELWKVWQAAQPAAGEPAADLHRLFEDAWANALCSDEGVPGKRPLRSLSDREQYRGGGVNAAWRWFQRGAQLSAPPAAAHGDSRVDDLATLVRRLVRSLRKASPDNNLSDKALDYLNRAGLTASPLRIEGEEDPWMDPAVNKAWRRFQEYMGGEYDDVPPAAAHGDEAVRIAKLLELADRHAERRLADARSDEEAAAELESSEENEAGNWYGACIAAADTARASAAIIKSLTDAIRSRAAMRAQGDGGADHA